MIDDCLHNKNVVVRRWEKKSWKISTFQNVLSADAERTADAESMNQALIAFLHVLSI